MPRKPRIHFHGAVYHVILRGNSGNDVFTDDADRNRFLSLVKEGIRRFGNKIHAFCLMSNHIHLIIEVADVPLSRIMHNLSFRYTAYLNKKKNSIGHVFHGRYKAVLVDTDNYLLELVRYIHNNPVAAGIVETPENYRWSSHLQYIGKTAIKWLTTDHVLVHFSQNRHCAIQQYQDFFKQEPATFDELQANVFKESLKCGILGDSLYVEEMLQQTGHLEMIHPSIDEIISLVCEYYGMMKEDFLKSRKRGKPSEARAVTAWLTRESNNATITDFSKICGRGIPALSQAATRLENQARNDTELADRMDVLKSTCFGL